MIRFLIRFLSRFAFRIFLTVLLFAIASLLGQGRAREAQKGFRRFGGDSGSSGGDSGRRAGAGRSSARPSIDRSDVVDVPFTEVPPAGDAVPRGSAAGDSGRSA